MVRALNSRQLEEYLSGKDITGFNPQGNGSLSMHVLLGADGVLPNDPWISLTVATDNILKFNGGFGVISVNLDAIPKSTLVVRTFDSPLIDMLARETAWSEREISVKGRIPRSAIEGFLIKPIFMPSQY